MARAMLLRVALFGGGVAGADAAFVLAEAGIAAVVVAVLDGPVATVPGEQFVRGQRGCAGTEVMP